MKVNVSIKLETPDFKGEEFFKEIKNLIEDIRVYSGDDKDALYLIRFSMGNAGDDEDERNYYWEIGE